MKHSSFVWLAVMLAIGMDTSATAGGDDLASTIAQRLHWPPNRSSIQVFKWEGLDGCAIYDAHDQRVIDAAGVYVARLRDGSLIFSSEAKALDKVFTSCVSSATPAATLANLMAGFSRYAGMVVLVEDDSPSIGGDLLKKAGREFAAPEISVEQGARLVKFYALSFDDSTLFEIKGRIGKQVTVKAKRLADTSAAPQCTRSFSASRLAAHDPQDDARCQRDVLR